ncbi:Map1p [Sugiyamaella lignohabitans]|uniref:Methionine aminopeptidase n=1 Tax=Sugiyamaella lignohabitans TaxID=796027 RepID=A0A167CE53_9ASCO|nr:Map1p [Sugiyamaella lignohabitans]ANB11573.1 Map1p [Sugiyamaella lignohabitans]
MIRCAGADCGKDAASLKCPTCLKAGVDSYFCDQTCFKRNWGVHKAIHPKKAGDTGATGTAIGGTEDSYNPFPESVYTGKLRACYPLSPRRPVKDSVVLPDYSGDGQPRAEQSVGRNTHIQINTPEMNEKMRKLGVLAREVLDIAAAAAVPGVTTDELDAIVHQACMDRDAYPSPLNYYNFPKSVCTSVNEVICHGIPDKYVLKDGDIVNLDVTLYKWGVYSDLNETYYVGDKAKADPDTVRLVETTREALDLAIATIKPGTLIRSIGDVIEKHAKANKVSVVRSYIGHGVNDLFHCAPNVPHCKFLRVCLQQLGLLSLRSSRSVDDAPLSPAKQEQPGSGAEPQPPEAVLYPENPHTNPRRRQKQSHWYLQTGHDLHDRAHAVSGNVPRQTLAR